MIKVEGNLEFGDERIFNDKVRGWNEGVVVFDSLGGNLVAGLGMGKTIRDAGLNTLVFDNEKCASACALAWLGGKTRLAGPRAQIAFHAAWMEKDGGKVETGAGNALVGAYLYSLGLRDRAIVYITQAAPDDAKWLSFNDAEALGIQVKKFELASLQQKDRGPDAPAAPAQAPAPLEKYIPDPPPREARLNPQWRPVDPVLEPQMLDLASLDAASQVQRRLQERGYFQGLIDGVWGPKSRIALQAFKTRNSLGVDDGWDLQTQLALFDDRSQAAWSGYAPAGGGEFNAGLFKPFTPLPGASLHPLNQGDATTIQAYLYRLKYYRKQGDGVWGMASRSALIDFKVANGLAPNDAWDRSVEEVLKKPYQVPATDTPFGEWAQDSQACSDLSSPGRLAISAQNITIGGATCQLDPPLQRATDGWRTTGKCSRGAVTEAARVYLQLINGRLVDRSVVGTVPNPKPAAFSRCSAPVL